MRLALRQDVDNDQRDSRGDLFGYLPIVVVALLQYLH
jgi:hypothetical protein